MAATSSSGELATAVQVYVRQRLDEGVRLRRFRKELDYNFPDVPRVGDAIWLGDINEIQDWDGMNDDGSPHVSGTDQAEITKGQFGVARRLWAMGTVVLICELWPLAKDGTYRGAEFENVLVRLDTLGFKETTPGLARSA